MRMLERLTSATGLSALSLTATGIAIGLFAFASVSETWLTVRPLWLSSMRSLLPKTICRRIPQDAAACAWQQAGTCEDTVSPLARDCLDQASSSIAFFIVQPAMGSEYGTGLHRPQTIFGAVTLPPARDAAHPPPARR